MFARLKKKIEEETHADLAKDYLPSSLVSSPSPTASRKSGSNQHSPTLGERHSSIDKLDSGKFFSLPSRQRKNSDNSIDSTSSDLLSAKHGLESMPIKLLHDDLANKNEQIRKLESKLQEYSKLIKEHTRTKEKLQDALEKQQDLMFKTQERKDEDWRVKLEAKEKERLDLLEKLKSAEMLKEQLFQKQEAVDEVKGFQTQEMAKVKHMLLNCQQELQNTQASLKEALLDLNDSKETIECLRTEYDRVQQQQKKEEADRKRKIVEDAGANNTIKQLEETNKALDAKLESLSMELNETLTKCSNMERTLSDLQDDNDALRHNYATQKEQSTKFIESKESQISHLEERVATLDQRLASSPLTGNDQVQALINERDALEQKLEESRHHLNEVKSTWSEKIMSLEKQISHLNEKIAEDSQEIRRLEADANTTKYQLQETISQLEEDLKHSTTQCQEMSDLMLAKDELLETRKTAYENELATHEKALGDLQGNLEEKIQVVENTLMSAQKLHQEEAEKLNQQIASLEEQVMEHLEKEIELEKQLQNAKEENDQMKNDLQNTTQQLEKSSQTLVGLGQMVANVEQDKREREAAHESLKKTHSETEEELQNLKSEFETQQQSANAISENLEKVTNQLKEEREVSCAMITRLESLLSDAQAEVANLQQQVKDAEESANQNIENSAKVTELRTSLLKLETELGDKTKTIRLQQQRINDMKKTLQRELKVQSGPYDAVCMEPSEKDSLLNSVSLHQRESHHSEIMQKLQSFDGTAPSSVVEDVNFCYLKHVILKFMTSREYEAQHLIKAVSVLLHFTPDEERLIKDTLEWKMSWFGAKPKYGKGQMSKTIPTT